MKASSSVFPGRSSGTDGRVSPDTEMTRPAASAGTTTDIAPQWSMMLLKSALELSMAKVLRCDCVTAKSHA
jgi:hypothetical protein